MDALGYYIFNADNAQWLQDDETTWGAFTGCREFNSAEHAEEIRSKIEKTKTGSGYTTYTMAALH